MRRTLSVFERQKCRVPCPRNRNFGSRTLTNAQLGSHPDQKLELAKRNRHCHMAGSGKRATLASCVPAQSQENMGMGRRAAEPSLGAARQGRHRGTGTWNPKLSVYRISNSGTRCRLVGRISRQHQACVTIIMGNQTSSALYNTKPKF